MAASHQVGSEFKYSLIERNDNMIKNMGQIDRVLRVLVAGIIGTLFLTNAISGISLAILAIVAIVFIATGFVGFCPLYSVLKISTGVFQPTKNGGVTQ
jgi:hypothetical protein